MLMFYLSKIDAEQFEKLKGKKGELSIKFRMAGWIKKLSDKDEFDNFFKTMARVKRCSVKYPTDVVDTRKHYSIEVDENDWEKFKTNARERGIYANSALNELVKEYNRRGDLFEINIKV